MLVSDFHRQRTLPFLPWSWWSVSNLVKIGEELRTLSSRIEVMQTDGWTDGRRNQLAPPILLSTTFCYTSNVVDNNCMKVCVVQIRMLMKVHAFVRENIPRVLAYDKSKGL